MRGPTGDVVLASHHTKLTLRSPFVIAPYASYSKRQSYPVRLPGRTELAGGRVMRRTQGSAGHPDEGCALQRRGNNISKNVNARMITPQERALLLESAMIREPLEQAISSRLAACVRDEAI